MHSLFYSMNRLMHHFYSTNSSLPVRNGSSSILSWYNSYLGNAFFYVLLIDRNALPFLGSREVIPQSSKEIFQSLDFQQDVGISLYSNQPNDDVSPLEV